ncbi:aminopeptidase N [Gallaecimonas sp. GXIMD4217]|uniref:aminopeptidase N n=1 Tax=Gallaecimonas sp. GXIMD4217 TaxID=3131927 RepID=UPI00311B322C
MANKPVKRLADYQAPDFLIDSVELCFELDDHQTTVRAVSQIRRNGSHRRPLVLDGEGMVLKGVALNGEAVSDYRLDDTSLGIATELDVFTLTVETQLDPAANTLLEGLYKSGGAFCTQCEAEGFRRITYFLDRPDVMAVYTTKVIADKACYPQLLANGNAIERGELDDGRHFVTWQDPHPKPCYLFALVAGDFDLLKDDYTTASGRQVALEIYVDKGRAAQASHAMTSLKAAMKWDEENYGREYDLDIYMIVAVDFFNMGAMENKGLNIFNAKYVLADDDTATDQDYDNIAAIIAHEYFHNWTGNRVTCRDWFQLSLKEGLTVFRDQQFSADWTRSEVGRIKEARVIRTQQFAEDAGPMAHPIRPEAVEEMNNFYTVTVYNKGAEVIRMLHQLLGKDGFRKGSDLYFERHDGQAVTCDDFVTAMADANGRDLSQFRLWYSQSGTPELTLTEHWQDGRYRLTVAQHTRPTADQADKVPLQLPLSIELIGDAGNQELTLDITRAEQSFELGRFERKPLLAPLCGFSAPVRLHFEQGDGELADLMRQASDTFVRFDAAQRLVERIVLARLKGEDHSRAMGLWLHALKTLCDDISLDPALLAELLTVPALPTLMNLSDDIDLDGLIAARTMLHGALFEAMESDLVRLYERAKGRDNAGSRALANAALVILAKGGEGHLAVHQYQHDDGMTLRQGALNAAVAGDIPELDALLADFEARFGDNPQVMDKWLMAQAQRADALERLPALTEHPAFDWQNPNRTRALIGTFVALNPQCHSQAGYDYLAQVLPKLDAINGQATARIVTPLLQWRRFDEARRLGLEALLKGLGSRPGLSADLAELIGKALA